jgi:ParB family transcriptional regulator, chromosome partitioning protein
VQITTEATITEGTDVGTVHKVCPNLSCPVHHSKQTENQDDAKWKAEQERQRKEQVIANAVGLRVLKAISAAVPVRLLRRDLLFVIEGLLIVMDESRIEMLARQHGLRQKRNDGGVKKALTAYFRRVDEGTLSRMLVESGILLASARINPTAVLKQAATTYKVDTEAIGLTVKQKLAAKARTKERPEPKCLRTECSVSGGIRKKAFLRDKARHPNRCGSFGFSCSQKKSLYGKHGISD